MTRRSGSRLRTGALLAVVALALLPAGAARAAGLEVVGKSNLGGAGLNGEVAVNGNTAIVASGILGGSGVRSSFRATYPCPATTVKVVDLSNPSAPKVASTIPVVLNAVASDVALLTVTTPSFTGNLAAVALVRCNALGNATERGVAFYDVTNRSNPAFLGRYMSDANMARPTDPACGVTTTPPVTPNRDNFTCAASNDQVALVQRPDGKVLSLSTEPFASNGQGPTYEPATDFHGDLRVVDATDPRSPVEVGSFPNGPARPLGYGAAPANPNTVPPTAAVPRYGQSNNGCRPFDSGYGPAAFPDGSKALLTGFDQGLWTVDLTDPANPFQLGQWSYDRNNRALEGNGAYVNFASVGGKSLALMGETDWIAPETRLRIDAPSSIAGTKYACEAAFTLYDPEDTAQIYRKPGSQVSGEIVYVGRACPVDQLIGGNGAVAGKIALRDASIVASRQTGTGNCAASAASKRLEDAGAKGTIIASVNNAANTARVQTFLGEGDQPEGGLTTPTIGLDIPESEQLRNALCPAPATPGTGCGPGGQPQTGAMVDSKGDWGMLRVVDVSNPAAPALRGTYEAPTSRNVFPPPDRGIYSVHHAVASGSRGYVAAHADGVRVIDLTSPSLNETASFVPPDTPDPTGSIPAKAHVTGVDAGPGGTIVISDMNSGLYVLRAARAPAPPPVYPQPSSVFPGCPTLTANVIRGTAASNVINGTPRADRIFAGVGDDRVDALGGADCVDLGAGTDRGQGGTGNDLLLGGLGRDRVSGGAGRDRIVAGPGRDTLSGGSSGDRLLGDGGNDRIGGGSGNDRITGGSGGDRITGSSGRDRLTGGSGGDRLTGGSGGDRLTGSSGGDRLTGGSGGDRLTGGSGNDRILARDRRRDRISCGRGRDRVVADRGDRVARDCERVRRR